MVGVLNRELIMFLIHNGKQNKKILGANIDNQI